MCVSVCVRACVRACMYVSILEGGGVAEAMFANEFVYVLYLYYVLMTFFNLFDFNLCLTRV